MIRLLKGKDQQQTSMDKLKDEPGSTCSFSSDCSSEDEILQNETRSESSGEDPLEAGNIDPTSVEIEAVGKGKRFVHQITASHPYQVFTVGGKRWWQRRSTKFWIILFTCLFLLILTIALPARKRTKSIAKPARIRPVSEGPGLSDYSGPEPTSPVASPGSTPALSPSTQNEVDSGELDIVEDRTFALFGPLSTLDPTVYFADVVRPADSSPSSRLDPLKEKSSAVPTNSWYQNLLLLRDGEVPSMNHQAYTLPYIVDVAGPIPGVRLHSGRVETSADQVIVSSDQALALTLGAAVSFSDSSLNTTVDNGYSVLSTNELGLTLKWNYANMKSSLVRGMPYATMIYPTVSDMVNQNNAILLPTIYGEQRTSEPIQVDGGTRALSCDGTFDADNDVELTFVSGYTWLIYFSQPVALQCNESDTSFVLQVVNAEDSLVVRMAMVPSGQESFKTILRQHANVYPGEATQVRFEMGQNQAALVMDWDPQPLKSDNNDTELIMFAMPHHQDRLDAESYCTPILLGEACLVIGDTWTIIEKLPFIDFVAPRIPDIEMLPDIVEAVIKDLSYRVPDNFLIGAGDTYFSGKALGKLARILVIAEHVNDLCSSRRLRSLQSSACGQTSLPTASAITEALDHLREAVEIWLNGSAQAPLLYDSAWGGVVSCGCIYAAGSCQNVYPTCPGLTDQGLNFGAGFYNDHHFHYGYHIYAAAVVAHFDADWGKANFERVLVLIRDIANPSRDDTYFPLFRHKDWYHGSSWASGISLPVSPTGMNQESSSEAIASYEAVALYGKTMAGILNDENKTVAEGIYNLGRILTSTELRSAKRYWQVSHAQQSRVTFDPTYQHNVVGILWSSKVFFGTWFGNSPYLIYGIQLLPLTTISEERDDPRWVSETFDTYAYSCDQSCIEEGWSVQILALLATLGHKEKALGHAKNLTDAVFASPGGNGHSMSNTLWYISTRPDVSSPYSLQRTYPWEAGIPELTCFSPSTCTDNVLGALAGEYDCRSRITYLMKQGKSEFDACYQIAVTEFPGVCGPCVPVSSASVTEVAAQEVVSSVSTISCNHPTTCTATVLRTMAGAFSCGDRINWLMSSEGLSEAQACMVVAVNEFPNACGGCNPNGN